MLVPLLDILQSVPILGFISITSCSSWRSRPGRVLGAEFAAIFAIFTSQAWNMAFSFYQSLRTVPTELVEASRNFRLSPWMRFWRVDVPFATPQLIWNMMLSMSGSWFFVVASEAISVGNTTITLPGVGSYIALAIEHQDLVAVGYAILTMLIVILIYDQVLFRPLVAWADRFRFEQEPGVLPPHSWVLTVLRRSRLVDRLIRPFASIWRRLLLARWSKRTAPVMREPQKQHGWITFQWAIVVTALGAVALWQVGRFVIARHHAFRHRHRLASRARDLDPHCGPDRHRQRDLGADRRMGRHATRMSPISSSRWRSFSPRFRRICCFPLRCR